MKILVDKMPTSTDDCPFADHHKSPKFHELMVCQLRCQAPDGHRVHCVCRAPNCDMLKEVPTDG